MRERCFLCGGPLVGGRCMECGLDNTKNDKKYQLNTHNASGAHFHEGDCADNLNQPKKLHRKKKKTEQREETFDYRKLLEQERRKVHAGSSYRAKKSVKETVSGKASSVDRLADKTKKDVTRSGSSAADSGRKNGSTRAGKKKNRLGTILVILFLAFSFAGPLLEHMADWLDEMLEEFGGYGFAEDDLFHWEDAEWVTEAEGAESFALSVSPGDSLGEPNEEWENSADSGDEDEIYGYIGPGENGEKPEVISYEEDSERYLEAVVENGMLTVGYDIPAGAYQFRCGIDSTEYSSGEVCWVEGKQGQYLFLYSPEAQKSYEEVMEEECEYADCSPEVVLEDRDVLFIQGFTDGSLVLCGEQKAAAPLRKQLPQNLSGKVEINGEMTAGTDFEAGVYDIVLEREDAVAYVVLRNEQGVLSGLYQEVGMTVDNEQQAYRRIPLTEGTELVLEYGEAGDAALIPSY